MRRRSVTSSSEITSRSRQWRRESATLFIAAPPNGSSVWARVVDEVSGAIFEQEITADLPAATQFLSPRQFKNNGATASAVAYDCAGVYLETDF